MGIEYLERLRNLAADLDVPVLYVAEMVDCSRGRRTDGSRIYALWDAYPHAGFVTFQSAPLGSSSSSATTGSPTTWSPR